MKVDPKLYIPTAQRRNAVKRNPQVPPARNPTTPPTHNPVPQPQPKYTAPFLMKHEKLVIAMMAAFAIAACVACAFV